MGVESPLKKDKKRSRTTRPNTDRIQYAWKSGDSWVATLPMEWVDKYHPESRGFYPVTFEDDDEFISLALAESTDKPETVEIFISSNDFDQFRLADTICKETESAHTKPGPKRAISKNRGNETEQEKKTKEAMKEAECAYNKLLRKIVASYLVGFNNIQILCDENCPSKTLPEWLLVRVARFIRTEGKLYGARCQKNTSTECLKIRVNLDFKGEPVRYALSEMCGYAEDALDLALRLLEKFDPKEYEDLQSFENEVDAGYFYIVRASKLALKNPHLITDMSLRNYRELMGYRVIAKSIERIADHSYKIASTLKELVKGNGDLGQGARRGANDLGREVRDVFDKMTRSLGGVKGGFFGEAYRGKGSYVQSVFFDAANDLIEKASCVIREEERIFGELNRKQSNEEPKTGSKKTVLEIWSERIVLESLRRIADYTITVGQIILNLSLESRLERAKPETEKVFLLKPNP